MDHEQRQMRVYRAISNSCIPLLCGDGKTVYRLANRLFRTYGIVSYAIIPPKCRSAPLLMRLFSAPAVRLLHTDCHSTFFLAETAVSFFSALDPTALPVLIDCTEDRMLSSDASVRARLEPHCTLTDAAHPDAVPPFCFLKEEP